MGRLSPPACRVPSIFFATDTLVLSAAPHVNTIKGGNLQGSNPQYCRQHVAPPLEIPGDGYSYVTQPKVCTSIPEYDRVGKAGSSVVLPLNTKEPGPTKKHVGRRLRNMATSITGNVRTKSIRRHCYTRIVHHLQCFPLEAAKRKSIYEETKLAFMVDVSTFDFRRALGHRPRTVNPSALSRISRWRGQAFPLGGGGGRL